MSIKVMSKVWEQSTQKGSALLLLLAIADHASDDGYCWPGTKTLAKKIRMSVRSVLRAIKSLENSGELYVIRSNVNNRYVVMVDLTEDNLHQVLMSRKMPLPIIRGDKLSPDKMTSAAGVGSDTGDGRSDTCVTSEVTQLCHPNHHEPSVNQNPTPIGGLAGDHSVMDHKDPFSMMKHCKDKRDQGSRIPDWAMIGSEGAHRFYPILAAFCALTQQDPALFTSKRGRGWLTKYERMASEHNLSPGDMLQAHEFLPDKDRGAWYIQHHKWTTPYSDSYEDQLVLAAMQVKGGSVTAKDQWSKAMI